MKSKRKEKEDKKNKKIVRKKSRGYKRIKRERGTEAGEKMYMRE